MKLRIMNTEYKVRVVCTQRTLLLEVLLIFLTFLPFLFKLFNVIVFRLLRLIIVLRIGCKLLFFLMLFEKIFEDFLLILSLGEGVLTMFFILLNLLLTETISGKVWNGYADRGRVVLKDFFRRLFFCVFIRNDLN